MTLPAGLVRLGASLPAEVVDEGRQLGRCVAAGLRVPVGAVLLDGHHDLGPLVAGEQVLLRVLGSHPAVRVPTDRPSLLAAGLRTVRLAERLGARQDVLVLRAVASVHAGRAATGSGHDVARAVEGEAHELDGSAEVRVLAARPLEHRWQRPHRGADPWRTPLPPWGMRLSVLLRDVRRVLGPAPLDITWADDGRVCRLLGVQAG